MQSRDLNGPSANARRITLLFLAAINAFGFVDRVVIALVAQQIKAEFRLSDLQIGLLGGTAFALVNIFAALPLARLADRTSRSLVVALSLLAGSIFTALCAATNSFHQLIVLRLGMAAGSAGTEAPAHSLISALYPPDRRASAISLFMLGVPAASILGSAAGGTIAEQFGWRATFLAFGIAGGVIALLATRLMYEPPRIAGGEGAGAPVPTRAVIATLWCHVHFRHVLIGTVLVCLGSFGVNTFLPAFFTRNFQAGAGQAGLLFGLVSGIASAAGTLVGGFGSERLARRHPGWMIGFPGVGLLLSVPLLLLGLNAPTLWTAVPLILIGTCFCYTAMGPAIALTHDLLGSRSRATGSALFLLVVYLVGQGLGPPLTGFASDRIAAWQFGVPDFATICAGAASQVAGSRCAEASAGGIRYAIAGFSLIYVWGAVHFLLAARGLGTRRALRTAQA